MFEGLQPRKYPASRIDGSVVHTLSYNVFYRDMRYATGRVYIKSVIL